MTHKIPMQVTHTAAHIGARAHIHTHTHTEWTTMDETIWSR